MILKFPLTSTATSHETLVQWQWEDLLKDYLRYRGNTLALSDESLGVFPEPFHPHSQRHRHG